MTTRNRQMVSKPFGVAKRPHQGPPQQQMLCFLRKGPCMTLKPCHQPLSTYMMATNTYACPLVVFFGHQNYVKHDLQTICFSHHQA